MTSQKIDKLGQDVQIAVTPTIISTKKEAKRRFEPVPRQCYFEDEISLFHFPVEDGYRFELSLLGCHQNSMHSRDPVQSNLCVTIILGTQKKWSLF